MLIALLLIAAAAPPEDGRGSAVPEVIDPVVQEGRGTTGSIPEYALSMRPNPRFRGGLGAAALLGVSNYAPALGVGFTFDAGA